MARRALDLLDAGDPAVGRIWRSLEATAQPSFFLSWGWIANWLAALPAASRPALAVVHDGHEPGAAFFLAQRKVRRNLVLQSNALFFNATGSPRHDGLGIEHNGLLAAPGARRSLAGILELLPSDWDELHLPAVDRYAFDDLGAASPLSTRYSVTIERKADAPYVDLAAVRTVAGGYEALVAATTRAHLRSMRGLVGGVDLEVATAPEHALDIYGELLRLHAREAAARGERGAFADAWCEAFHRKLIVDRLALGEIQLVRVSSGGATLGCLYNFVYRGRVHAYQGGFTLPQDPALDPAALCHAAAIELNALLGHATYELLGSYAAHADALATGFDRLVWLRVERPLFAFSLEHTARRWYDAVRGRPQLAAA